MPDCPHCRAPARPGAAFCYSCGAPFPPQQAAARACPNCQLVVPAGLAACPWCRAGGSTTAAPRSRKRSGLLAVAGVAAGVILLPLALAAAGAVLWATTRSDDARSAPLRGNTADPLRPPELPALDVKPGARAWKGEVDGTTGGILESRDGLEIRITPGTWQGRREIKIHTAMVAPPAASIGAFGGPPPATPFAQKTWSIDAGEEKGLFAREVEVSVPAAPGQLQLPMISVDGRTWRMVDSAYRDGRLVFRTRHFSPAGFFSIAVHPAYALVLGVAAVSFLVYYRVEELPRVFHPDLPFTALPGLTGAYELRWSRKVPGANAPNGFLDEAGYQRRLTQIYEHYRDIGGCAGGGASSCRAEIQEARRTYLLPPKVREVDEALQFALSYIESRGFQSPAFQLPVYVVPTCKDTATGVLYNPYLGRRYMLLCASASREAIYQTALHELFHHFQTGYAFWDRNGLVPMAEASATLLEREAAAHYLKNAQVQLLTPSSNNAWFDLYQGGLDATLATDESSAQAHGYGLSWFLEYLRDNKYQGADKSLFHRELLSYWGGTYVSAHHKTLRWAAGGSDTLLGDALDSFAFYQVLPGMTGQNAYGKKYFPSEPATVFHQPFTELGLDKEPSVTFGKKMPQYSIQYYSAAHPARPGAQAVLRIPRAWTTTKPSRNVYVGENADANATIKLLAQVESGAGAEGDYSYALLRSNPGYFFVVDKGAPKPGWFSSGMPEAHLFALEPPSQVQSKGTGDLDVQWKRPPAAGTIGLEGMFFVYPQGADKRAASVSDSKSAASVSSKELAGKTQVEVSWAVQIGTRNGQPVYLESARSGGAPSGDVVVTAGALPERWTDETSRTRYWSQPAGAVRKETKLLLHLIGTRGDQKKGMSVYGSMAAALYSSAKTVDQLKAECAASGTPEQRQNACFVAPDATAASISGYPAWRSHFGMQTRPLGTGCSTTAATSYLVDLGKGTYVVLVITGSATQVMGQDCEAESSSQWGQAEGIAKAVKIERR